MDTENQAPASGPKKLFKKWRLGPVRTVIFLLFLGVFLVSAGMLARNYMEGQKVQNDFSKLTVSGDHDLSALHEQNKDLVAWIEIPGTRINYPVMQTPKNPDFYLTRNFKKEYSLAGTPFMDGHSVVSPPTLNWTVYGHNMKNGTMFHDLLKYADESFYMQHKTFTFDTLAGDGTYVVVAAFYTQIYMSDYTGFKYYRYNGITQPTELTEYIEGAKALSEYDTGVTVLPGEQVVTLSTCAYHVDDGRFVVVAKKID